MRPAISTEVFLPHRLTTGLLDALQGSGATAIEIFAARHHFDYTDRSTVRGIAAWFRDTALLPTLHQPLYADAQWSRHVAPNLNLIDPERSRRILAMDEVKRALESAEQIPFASLVLHLGGRNERWDNRALENSLTAIEHVKAFAAPLGVQLLLENLQNEVTTPEHLLEILHVGHFEAVGICLDIGHAHLAEPVSILDSNGERRTRSGIDHAFDLLGRRVTELHIHDNNGARDEHLWPGSIEASSPAPHGMDWTAVQVHAAALPAEIPGVLEISHDLHETPESVTHKASAYFAEEARRAEALYEV